MQCLAAEGQLQILFFDDHVAGEGVSHPHLRWRGLKALHGQGPVAEADPFVEQGHVDAQRLAIPVQCCLEAVLLDLAVDGVDEGHV